MPEQQTRLIAPAADAEIRDAVAIHIALRHVPAAAPDLGGDHLRRHVGEAALAVVQKQAVGRLLIGQYHVQIAVFVNSERCVLGVRGKGWW